jgi:hypothetical protein
MTLPSSVNEWSVMPRATLTGASDPSPLSFQTTAVDIDRGLAADSVPAGCGEPVGAASWASPSPIPDFR